MPWITFQKHPVQLQEVTSLPGQSYYKQRVVTDMGWEGLLRNLTSTQPELGPDITSLTVKADTSQSDILHISITDLHDERWHVPPSLFPESSFGACLPHQPTCNQQCLQCRLE